MALALPEPASPLEALLLRGFLLDVLRHRLGVTGDDLLRVALGPLSVLLPVQRATRKPISPDGERVRQFLESHLHEPVTLTGLCRALGKTKRSLEEAFRKAYGTTIHSYLQHCRMLTAFGLLLDLETKAEFVHQQVGYKSRSAFYRAFRQAFGRSPAQIARRRRTK